MYHNVKKNTENIKKYKTIYTIKNLERGYLKCPD